MKYIISDVHGCKKTLEALINKIAPSIRIDKGYASEGKLYFKNFANFEECC